MGILDSIIKLDKELFLFLNGINNSVFDFLMFHISEKITWVPLYIFVAVLIYRKFKLKNGLLILLMFGLLISLTDQTSVHLFKNTIQRFRPCFNNEILHQVHFIEIPGSKFGFVSSHAANAFGFAVLSLLVLKNKTYTISILIWAIVVSYSRIYLGVHYPGDILGGAFLGTFLTIPVYIILNKFVKLQNY